MAKSKMVMVSFPSKSMLYRCKVIQDYGLCSANGKLAYKAVVTNPFCKGLSVDVFQVADKSGTPIESFYRPITDES